MKNRFRFFVIIFLSLLSLCLLIGGFIFVKNYYHELAGDFYECKLSEKVVCNKHENSISKNPLHIYIRIIDVSNVAFIVIIISLVVLLGIIIICFTILMVKIDSIDLKGYKISKIENKYENSMKNLLSSPNNTYLKVNIYKKKYFIEKEYYSKNKASVDLFKAYASAIENI